MYNLNIHMMGSNNPVIIQSITEQELENTLIELKNARDDDRYAMLEVSGVKELLNIDNLLRVQFAEIA